uniref:Maturase K n=1 Tax=Romanomermis culicivorax TaxID=13658 RepID=A0A915J100_ROMCU
MKSFNLLHFKKLWDEYFYSMDPNSLGNHLFGVLE